MIVVSGEKFCTLKILLKTKTPPNEEVSGFVIRASLTKHFLRMKHSISLLTLAFLGHFSMHGQSLTTPRDLEGVWYQEGRTALCYSIWYYSDAQTLRNRTFSVICGDTIQISTAVVTQTGLDAGMTIYADSAHTPQNFKLTQQNDDVLLWENTDPTGSPRQIEWRFSGNNYCVFRADDVEIAFRRKRTQPTQLQIQMQAGVNRSQFPQNKYSSELGFADNTELRQLLGQDFALSAGLVFPETPLLLKFEIGVTHRLVGVRSTLWAEEVAYYRDGVYEYYNTYLALMPELSFGKKRSLALSAGFYLGLAQIRNFSGTNSATGAGTPNPRLQRPQLDVSNEHGFLAGASYCLPVLPQLRPSIFVRHTRGLINSKVKATSLGMAFQIGQKSIGL
jgi:hypothetical protein